MRSWQIALQIVALVVVLACLGGWLAASWRKARDEDMKAARGGPPQGFLLDAAPPIDGLPVERCVTRFFIRPEEKRRYCAQDGDNAAVHCHTQPTAAIVDANEDAGAARCTQIYWGFGCDPDLLCRLQQSGSNLVSDATAELVRKHCGLPSRLSC